MHTAATRKGGRKIERHIRGEYVRYDQAAAVIAAKDARWRQCESDKVGMLEHIADLEAKLAQIEKQEAIDVDDYIAALDEAYNFASTSPVARDHINFVLELLDKPLYTGPVTSDAELRAGNERLQAEKAAMRKAATDYCWQRYKGRDPMNLSSPAVFTSHEWQKIGEAMDEAIAALNPSETRT